jgi:tetratricopeptide (TPR) repeat protein
VAAALAGLVAWVALRPADPEKLLAEARAEWSAGRLDRAADLLDRLGRLRPLSTLDRLLAAQVDRQRGRPEAGLETLRPVPDDDPLAAEVAIARGLLEVDRAHFRAAERQFLRAVGLDPRRVEPRRELINLYALQGRRKDLDAQFRVLSAVDDLTFDDGSLWCLGRRLDQAPDEAAAALRKAAAADPEDRNSRLALADILRRLGRLDEAESVLAAFGPDDPDANAARASIALDRGEAGQAQVYLSGGPRNHPGLARIRGRLALARGDAPAAAEHFRAVLDSEPDDRDALSGLGRALTLDDRRTEAIPHLQAADRIDELSRQLELARTPSNRQDVRQLRALGETCLRLDRPAQARVWYRLALASDPLAEDIQRTLYEIDQGQTPKPDGPTTASERR